MDQPKKPFKMKMRNIASVEIRNEISKSKKNDYKSHDIELG